jgi:hypothetical protein
MRICFPPSSRTGIGLLFWLFFDDPAGLGWVLQGASLSASISERRPVSNYRCFDTFPQALKTQPAGDGGEPTSAIARLEQEPVEWANILCSVG